jgi:putative transcriptional regulator
MKKKYQSEILQIVHENAVANFKVGAITEERLHEYDRACLVPETSVAQAAKSAASSSRAMKPSPAFASKAN